MKMRDELKRLEERRKQVLALGGEKRVARQKERGKWTARERLDYLLDRDSFLEYGMHATQMGTPNRSLVPADAVVVGIGRIEGRTVAVISYDFTVKGGSIGRVGDAKCRRMRDIALKQRIPVIWLIDSAGARIDPDDSMQDGVSLFADSGDLFRDQVFMSGVVPQVAAMVGPGAAGTGYIPGLADFVPMVQGTSSMALAGPALVRAAVGEVIDEQSLGGAKMHCTVSGMGDYLAENDADCLDAVKKYLSYFPSNCHDQPPLAAVTDPPGRREESLLDLLPESSRGTYDMYDLIRAITDHGDYFDIKGKWAKSLITCFARLGGYSVGIVANNPKHLGGILDVDSADKAARFINLCDAFNIPLLYLVDVPGFMVGSRVEQQGIIRHGAKMLFATANASVAKLTVVVRKSYGAGYYVMCGKHYEPDYLVAWPGAEIAVMGADGMVGIHAIKMGGIDNMPAEVREKTRAKIVEEIDIYKTAGWDGVDDIIDPRDTRPLLIEALRATRNKKVERPWRKNTVTPV
jgi:acetyl-CoA carboxylase carboxyltransferase component